MDLEWCLDGNEAVLLTCQSEKNGRCSMPVAMKTEWRSAANIDAFSAKDSKDYTSNGKTFRVCFNPDYLADFLDNSTAEHVTLKLLSANSAGLIADATNDTGYMVLMPLAL